MHTGRQKLIVSLILGGILWCSSGCVTATKVPNSAKVSENALSIFEAEATLYSSTSQLLLSSHANTLSRLSESEARHIRKHINNARNLAEMRRLTRELRNARHDLEKQLEYLQGISMSDTFR
jgi:t-SNARE complex subunit (syntaxin)